MSKFVSAASCDKSVYKSLCSSSSSLAHAASLQCCKALQELQQSQSLPVYKSLPSSLSSLSHAARCKLAKQLIMFTRACTDTRCKLACNIGISIFCSAGDPQCGNPRVHVHELFSRLLPSRFREPGTLLAPREVLLEKSPSSAHQGPTKTTLAASL